MGVHILAIGRPNKTRNELITHVVDNVRDRVHGLGSVLLARCETIKDLLQVVAHHGRGEGRIDILDIFDHGAPGRQRIGKEILFESDEQPHTPLSGEHFVHEMNTHLSEVAQIRLLGCLVTGGDGKRGRFLLVKLARALGRNRVAFGMIEKIDQNAFGPNGFPVSMIDSFLFSSLAALDGVAPETKVRVGHIIETRPC